MRRISTSLIAYYLSVFQTHKHLIQDTDLGNSCQEIILRYIILIRNLSFSILNYFLFLLLNQFSFLGRISKFAENHPEAKLLQKSYNLLLALNQAKHNKNWVYFDSILKGNNLPVNTYRNACRIKNQAEETTEQR